MSDDLIERAKAALEGNDELWLLGYAPDLARALIETTAERDALRVLLVEARDELAECANADWPEPSRSHYPDIMRRWKRDMDLCWRIDAGLQEDTPND